MSGLHWLMLALNLFPLIPACTARPGLPLSPPETAFLESPYYRPQTASIGDRHHPTNFHSVTYTQTDDAAFEAGSDNDHKSFLRYYLVKSARSRHYHLASDDTFHRAFKRALLKKMNIVDDVRIGNELVNNLA